MPEIPSGVPIDSTKLIEVSIDPSQPAKVDLVGLYQDRVEQFRQSQPQREDPYITLKRRVDENTKTEEPAIENPPSRNFNVADRLRHKALLAEARVRGVKDLEGFQKLVEYFESTISTEETQYKTLWRKLNPEQERELQEKWLAAGYKGVGIDRREGKRDRLFLRRNTSFNLQRKNIPLLKEFLALNSDPIAIIQTLRETGMYFGESHLGLLSDHPDYGGAIKKILAAPNSKELMNILGELHSVVRMSSNQDSLMDIINFAENPNLKEVLSPETIEKIKVICRAGGVYIAYEQLPKYIQLVSNPGQFNFLTAYLNQPNHPVEKKLLEDLDALDQAQLLKPLFQLSQLGINLDHRIFTPREHSVYEGPKTQEEIISALTQTINDPELQALLQDSQKQEFIQILGQTINGGVKLSELKNALKHFDKKNELLYLKKLCFRDEMINANYLDALDALLNNENFTNIYDDQGFSDFIDELRTQGYQPNFDDFQSRDTGYGIHQPMILDVYSLREIISVLGQDTSIQLLESVREGNYGLLNNYLEQGRRPLLQKDLLEKIPSEIRKEWIKTIAGFPTYAGKVIQERMDKNGIDEDLFTYTKELSEIFKQVDGFMENTYLSDLVKQFIAGYEGNLDQLYKNGQPTYELAKHFMDIKQEDVVQGLLTNELINSLDQDSKQGLLIWKELPATVRVWILYVPGFPKITPAKFKYLEAAVSIYETLPIEIQTYISSLRNGGTLRFPDLSPIELANFRKLGEISKRLKTFVPNNNSLSNIINVLLNYPGPVDNLFKDGHPTVMLSNHFLTTRDFQTLHPLITEEFMNTLTGNVREAITQWRTLSDNVRYLIAQNIPGFPDVPNEQIKHFKDVSEALSIIENSSSKEIKKLQGQIMTEILATDNPTYYLRLIVDVFERNNLPIVGKVYRVFEILHPSNVLEAKLNGSSNLSPVLVNSQNTERYGIIYRDLLRVSIYSANPSLYGFLKAMQEGQEVIIDIEQNGISVLEGPENIGKREAAVRFMNRLDILYESSTYGRNRPKTPTQASDIQERILNLKDKLRIRGNQSLVDRVSTVYLRPLGFSSIDQVVQKMESSRKEANERNTEYAETGQFSLNAGDLLKGIDIQFLENILQNGSVAKEYLGADANSDMTPFDTDTSMILESDVKGGFRGTIENSVAGSYGNLFLVFKDRGQFQHSEHLPDQKYDPEKYELFSSGVVGERHYGIRTGIPSTEVDAMIARNNLAENETKMQRLFYTIAQSEVYIPVLDEEGKILFTPKQFEQYKIKGDEIKNILTRTDFNSEELLESLEKSPFIKGLYEGDVGVSEGYTLKEHTKMVMGQYEKYFKDRWTSPLVSQQGFRLMLALHDLGKPLAVQITGSRAAQHEYTMKFLPKIIESSGINPREAEILIAIANQDYIGEHIQGHLDTKTAAKNIKDLAADTGVPVNQLFELFKMYYMSDAGAYTEDAGGKSSLDRLFVFQQDGIRQMRLSDEPQAKLEEINRLLYLV